MYAQILYSFLHSKNVWKTFQIVSSRRKHVRQILTWALFSNGNGFHLWNEFSLTAKLSNSFRFTIAGIHYFNPKNDSNCLVYGNISHISKHRKSACETFLWTESAVSPFWFSISHKTLRIQLFRMKKMKFYYTKYEIQSESE